MRRPERKRNAAASMRIKVTAGDHHLKVGHPSSTAMSAPAGSRRWPQSVLWKLGSLILLILLERIQCSANPSYLPDTTSNPSVNIYMSLEEVKKLLGKADQVHHCLSSAFTPFSRRAAASTVTR